MVGYCSLDSRKTVNQIDVEIKNVGLSSILLSLFSSDFTFFLSRVFWLDTMAITFEDPFCILRFDRDYSAKLDGAESLIMKVSRPRRCLKLLKKKKNLYATSLVPSSTLSLLRHVVNPYSSSLLNHRLTLQSSTLYTSTSSATHFTTDSI